MLKEKNSEKEDCGRPFRRIAGGSGFADSIFRTQADSRNYAYSMLRRVLRREELDEESIRMFCRTGMFVFMKEEDVLLILTERDIELLRAGGIHALEDFLARHLLEPEAAGIE
ncbi:MAG TPA: hypothetical protein GX720_04730 [Clostridiaceae bacterium]|nr:hypothetical protein [Clostridiaceae bacterium]